MSYEFTIRLKGDKKTAMSLEAWLNSYFSTRGFMSYF